MRFLALVLLSGLTAFAAAAQTEVELELVLLADASSSIKGDEFELQINGYSSAFRDPEVIEAVRNLGGNGIAVTFIQWSALFQQFDIVPWRRVYDTSSAQEFASAIESQARQVFSFGTATGSALIYGFQSMGANGFSGKRRVIDITSDERSNSGPHPRSVRRDLVAAGVTINGLAILDDAQDLETYFRESVIGGPGNFVLVVDSYADFAWAIRLKLEREISGTPLF